MGGKGGCGLGREEIGALDGMRGKGNMGWDGTGRKEPEGDWEGRSWIGKIDYSWRRIEGEGIRFVRLGT